MKLFLRWSLSPHETFPFQFNISEKTTVSEICKMIRCKNNQWQGNPTFSIIKLYDYDNHFADDNSEIGNVFNKDEEQYLIFAAG